MGREGRVRQISSLYGVGGATGYTAQDDLNSVKLQHGGGKDDKGLVFPFLDFQILLGFICSFVLGSPHSPAPQFKSIHSLALGLYGPLLISIHDYWKNHKFKYMDLCP